MEYFRNSLIYVNSMNSFPGFAHEFRERFGYRVIDSLETLRFYEDLELLTDNLAGSTSYSLPFIRHLVFDEGKPLIGVLLDLESSREAPKYIQSLSVPIISTSFNRGCIDSPFIARLDMVREGVVDLEGYYFDIKRNLDYIKNHL